MSLVVHQSIVIHQLRVDTVSSASVLQIGTAGSIRSLANIYNTGGFGAQTQPSTSVVVPFSLREGEGPEGDSSPSVPLPDPN